MEQLYTEAFNTYYSLKNQYEKNYEKQKRKITTNDILSLKEKRKQIKRIEKKCIVCKKIGGTIFNENGKNLTARCGASIPCGLDINITRGDYINILDMINYMNQVNEINKREIILTKLDMLYDYSTEEASIEKFTEYKKELEDNSSALDVYKAKLNEVMYNDETDNKVRQLNIDLYNKINEIKLLITQYNENPIANSNVFTTIAELMTTDIDTLLKELRAVRYKVNDVVFNESDKTFNLIQMPYSTQDLNMELEDLPTVTSFSVDSKKKR